MSAEFLPWAIEATAVISSAILLALGLRIIFARVFGIRAAILIWVIVPLALIAAALPARSTSGQSVSESRTVIALDGLGAAAAAARDLGHSISVPWHATAFAAWLAGAVLMLLVLAHRQRRFRRLLGVLRPVGRRLFISERSCAGPSVLGAVRPRVILPRDFTTRFGPRKRRLMLAHEYTHLKRADPVWNLVAAGFSCLFWFNPLVHVAAIRFRRDQELACDATVLARRRGARRDYASALLAQRDDLPVPAIGFGAHPLKERIRMLAKLNKTSSQRHRAGSLVAVALALAMAAVAWAANPEAESADPPQGQPFAFDIEVTVDGRSQAGILTLTGDTAVSSVGGQPRMLANDMLRLEHRDEESGWSAEVTIIRMPEERFSVTATIARNEEVVATPRMIIGAESPASIETRDPDTGEVAYRLLLTPVDPERGQPADVSTGNSAVLRLRIDDADSVARPVQWPRAPGDSMSLPMIQGDGPDPWNAWVGLKRLEGDRIELCLESFHQESVTYTILEAGGCMTFDANHSSDAYMVGAFEEAGISWRLDMIPMRVAPGNDRAATRRFDSPASSAVAHAPSAPEPPPTT